MRIQRLFVRALPALALLALPIHAAVTVTYGEPDGFYDAGDRNSDPRKVMASLAAYLKSRGERVLPAGTDLKIEVLDLDRAGRPRMNLPTEIRVVTGRADAPCMELRYSLESEGKVLQSGPERVCDVDYLRPLEFKYDAHDALVYEKRMLDRWLQERFARGALPR